MNLFFTIHEQNRLNVTSKEKEAIELHSIPSEEKDCSEGENSDFDEKQSSSNDTESVCEICKKLSIAANKKRKNQIVTRSVSFSNIYVTKNMISTDLISRNSVPDCLGVFV